MDTNTNDDLSAVNMISLKNTVTPKADKTYVDEKITSFHDNKKILTSKKNIILSMLNNKVLLT